MAKKNITLDDDRLAALFIQHYALRNCSPLTIRQLEQAIRVFRRFLNRRGIKGLMRLRRADFEAYKEFLAGYPTFPATLAPGRPAAR